MTFVGVVDFNSDYEDEDEEDAIEPKSLCRRCKEYGVESALGPKILQPDEPRPTDYDLWRQCGTCGTLYAIHEIAKESQVKDVVSTTDSPFDSGVEFLGIDCRKLSKKRRIKQQDDYDYIQDKELQKELMKGSKLISYSEQLPQ